ncbi:hypothetical protein AB0F17_61970 [Nonomuraea sp. NPDC026600]|uniref:hypothetical protein n=1 Tax=Nonomuraea sp. NPDC026600 TaxID=3155363 RepID=UPI0034102DCA
MAPHGRRPVLAMDVDDVLLPASTRIASRAEAGGMPVYEQRLYVGPGPDGEAVSGMILVNALHGAWLRSIAALDVEIVWATSWGQMANSLLARAYDLPDLPVLNVGRYDSDTRFGCSLKRAAVIGHVGERPLVWVDNVWRIALTSSPWPPGATSSRLILQPEESAEAKGVARWRPRIVSDFVGATVG